MIYGELLQQYMYLKNYKNIQKKKIIGVEFQKQNQYKKRPTNAST